MWLIVVTMIPASKSSAFLNKRSNRTMNQDRFDDIARAVAANRLSRLQALRAIAAGVVLAGPLGALLANPASAKKKKRKHITPCPPCGACSNPSCIQCGTPQTPFQVCFCLKTTEGQNFCASMTGSSQNPCTTSADCTATGESCVDTEPCQQGPGTACFLPCS
jgi:hypothetical protein